MNKKITQLKTILVLVTAFFLSAVTWADVQLKLEPQLISLLDTAVLSVEFINTKGQDIQLPTVDGLNIQYQGQRSETQIINMRRTHKVVHTYLVRPEKVGDFDISPVRCRFKGGEKSLSAQLRVITPENDKEAQEISSLLFSEITTDKNHPFVHDPFNLTVKVYIHNSVQIDGQFGLVGGMPEAGLDGEPEWDVTQQTREERNGQIFSVYTLQTTVKTINSGTFSFQPQVQVRLVVPRQKRRSHGFNDPFFGDMFGRQEVRPLTLDCNLLKIEAQPIPLKNRPESYTGGVGLFDFDVSVSPTTLKTGEPITIKTRIFGRGNLHQLTPPTIKEDPNIKLYEVRSLPAEHQHEVLFEQVVIPKSEDITEIPEIAFSYFNTTTADFRTIKKGPFAINVLPGEQQAAQVLTSSLVNEVETAVLGHDIIYLKPAPKQWLMTHAKQSGRSKLLYLILILPALLLLASSIFASRKNHLANNAAKVRRQKAPKNARKNIRNAELAIKEKDDAAFCEAMWNTLINYFGHRLNLAPGEVTLPNVTKQFPQESESLTMLFNTIEQRRYGNHSNVDVDEMKELLKQLNTTLRACERRSR